MAKKTCRSPRIRKAARDLSTASKKTDRSKAGAILARHGNKHH